MGITIERAARTGGGRSAQDLAHPVAEAPFGAVVVVHRKVGDRFEYLLLRRADAAADEDAWAPPIAARLPGERVKDCARRGVVDATSMSLPPIPTAFGRDGWDVFLAQAPPTWAVRLSDQHDGFAWLSGDEAAARCLRVAVAGQIRRVAAFVEGRTA